MASLYLHIPFCSQLCNYCDFYSSRRVERIEQFVEALIIELKMRREHFALLGESLSSLYIGGGTPSLLTIEQLSRILEAVEEHYPLKGVTLKGNPAPDPFDLEVTIELNPDDIDLSYAKGLRQLGFNRASLGIQSFIEHHLRWMNRRHSVERGVEAYYALREGGFDNITIDLLFGYSLLSEEEWLYSLERALELSPQHLSTYQLAVEEATALHRDLSRGSYKSVDEESAFNQYRAAQELLSGAGYQQYELSSFALPGMESQHNSSYWEFAPYLGFGPSAHSFDGHYRSWNSRGIERYIEGGKSGHFMGGREFIDPLMRLNEYLMLSLRRVEGMEQKRVELLAREAGEGVWRELSREIERGVRGGSLLIEGGKIKIPQHHLYISDLVVRDLFIV